MSDPDSVVLQDRPGLGDRICCPRCSTMEHHNLMEPLEQNEKGYLVAQCPNCELAVIA